MPNSASAFPIAPLPNQAPAVTGPVERGRRLGVSADLESARRSVGQQDQYQNQSTVR